MAQRFWTRGADIVRKKRNRIVILEIDTLCFFFQANDRMVTKQFCELNLRIL